MCDTFWKHFNGDLNKSNVFMPEFSSTQDDDWPKNYLCKGKVSFSVIDFHISQPIFTQKVDPDFPPVNFSQSHTLRTLTAAGTHASRSGWLSTAMLRCSLQGCVCVFWGGGGEWGGMMQ